MRTTSVAATGPLKRVSAACGSEVSPVIAT